MRIQKFKENKDYKGFFTDVFLPLASSGGKSFSFIPTPFFFEKNDPKELVKLKKNRNAWLLVFWLLFAFIFIIGIYFGGGHDDK